MRFGLRTPPPRHSAGDRQPVDPLADFDVDAALADPEFDFEALFEDTPEEEPEPAPRARVARHRIAFAVSVTLAAVPLLVLDNLPATAGTGERPEELYAAAEDASSAWNDIDAAEALQTPATAAPATVFVAEPEPEATEPEATEAPATTATTVAPTTTTTAPPPTTTAAPTTTTTVAVARAAASAPDPNDPATWDRLAMCESSGNWSTNTGNGYYGGLQFSLSSWESVGGTGYPHEHSRATQIEMGKRLQARSGWGAWPTCAANFGWI